MIRSASSIGRLITPRTSMAARGEQPPRRPLAEHEDLFCCAAGGSRHCSLRCICSAGDGSGRPGVAAGFARATTAPRGAAPEGRRSGTLAWLGLAHDTTGDLLNNHNLRNS